jgi:hypothetical protein
MSRLESPLGAENGLVEPSPEAHASRRTLHGQVPGPRPPEGTGEGPECYPSRPEAHSGTLLVIHAGDHTRYATTTCPRHYP